MKHLFLLFFIISFANIKTAMASFNQTHSDFNKILKSHVTINGNQSLFNYKKLRNHKQFLETYLQTISSVTKDQFKNFTKQQRLAFLINAYNAFTIKIIVDNYPVKSIKDIGSFFTNTWKKKFFTIFGQKSYLDNIEHNLIRKNFNEPRIHFAVNCASISCPSLQNKAFTGYNLELLLEAGTIHFLTNKSKNYIDIKEKTLHLSKIFKWYGQDFVKKFGSLEKFIAKYITSNKQVKRDIINNKYHIEWLDYNWNLNNSK